MKRIITTIILTLMASAGKCLAQIEEVKLDDGTTIKVDRSIFPDLDVNLLRKAPPAEYTARRKARAEGRAPQITLPPYVYNGEDKYFPPIFNQDGGSCGSAQNIGYMFTHEINALRDLDASKPENQYPTHFTWLLTFQNSEKEDMARANGIPNVTTYGGRTYSRLFGAQTHDDNDYGWMQGYDKWYSAMWNRAANTFSMTATNTPEGRRELKEWLYNHSGDETMHSGGIAGIGVAAYGTWEKIPASEANDKSGVTGMKYVKAWGDTYNHAVTICGYDDRIEFDLDEDGIVGEVEEDEVGAWIIANSWGDGWENKGFIYCPYKYSYSVGTDQLPWTPGTYNIRRNYRPLRTIKLLMDYSHRSEMLLCAGVAQNLEAQKPERTVNFEHFKYAGNAAKEDPAPEVPMLGRWTDGLHYEPMEFGYDLTDLTECVDRTRPLKYFFIVKTQSGAIGKGHIYKASIMNYETDENGVEIPFEQQDVEISSNGTQTIITCTVPGEQLYPATNLQLTDGVLAWNAPQKSGLELKGYNIYAGNERIASVPSDKTFYTPETIYEDALTVRACYQLGKFEQEAKATNTVSMTAPTSGDNVALRLNESGITIPGIFTEDLNEATIEFWIYHSSLANYIQQVGPGWGKFLFHTDKAGMLYAGWNTTSGDRMMVANGFPANRWCHVAIVIKGNIMTAYVNGIRKGQITSKTYTGLTGFGDLRFGNGSSQSWWKGSVDEIRVWKTARTATEIKQNMRIPIERPALNPDLLAYINMDTIETDGEVKLRDWARGHHASIQKIGEKEFEMTETPFTGTKPKAAVEIEVEDGTHTSGMPVGVKALCPLNAIECSWSAPDSKEKVISGMTATLTFDKPGTYTVTCTTTFSTEETATATQEVTIVDGSAPVAAFDITSDELPAGDRFCFINRSEGEGCSYLWEMPEAEEETCTATNATALYPKTGTFKVTLTVSNQYGKDSMTKTVTVKESAPKPLFDMSKSALILGDTLTLEDLTRYNPESWQWELNNGSRAFLVEGQSPSVVPTAPGVYDVTLHVGNALGEDALTKGKVLTICSEDPGACLNFTGRESLRLECPYTEEQKQVSIEWWMRAQDCTGSFNLTSASTGLTTSVNDKGAITIKLGTRSAASEDGYVIPGEWHHYCITYNLGTVKFYRDMILVCSSTTRLDTRMPALGEIVVGSETEGLKGQIDEVRLWAAVLTPDKMAQYSNRTIKDITQAEEENKLLLYYDFNQNGGNVTDRTSGRHDAERINFGPDGDAWNSAIGVFTLDTEAATHGDMSAAYLTNYKNPFQTTTGTVNPANSSRFKKLAMNTSRSTWRDKNAVVYGSVITGAHIDTGHSSNITFETVWSGFAANLLDYRLWQPVTLPAGKYRFVCNFGDGSECQTSRLVACKGNEMVSDALCEEQALAWAKLQEEEISFTLDEETEVSLGVIINLQGKASFNIKSFTLEGQPYEWLKPIGGTDIALPEMVQPKEEYSKETYDLTGRRTTANKKGVYITAGKKIIRN